MNSDNSNIPSFNITKFFEDLEHVIRQDPGKRGISKLICPEIKDDLFLTCSHLIQEKTRTVGVISGFFCAEKAAETDGPLGTVAIVRALLHLGKTVFVITDDLCHPVYEAALKFEALTDKCQTLALPTFKQYLSSGENAASDKALLNEEEFEQNSRNLAKNLLEKYKFDHLLAIERASRAADGRCYTMKAKDVSQFCSVVIDTLFEDAIASKHVVTSCIGDGGNELGMGKVGALIAKYIENGGRIGSKAKANYVIPCGVSNWGGLAIAAGLLALFTLSPTFSPSSLHQITDQFLPTAKEEFGILKAIVEAGSIDGIKGTAILSVDGFPYQDSHENILLTIRDLIKKVVM